VETYEELTEFLSLIQNLILIVIVMEEKAQQQHIHLGNSTTANYCSLTGLS